MYSTNTYCLSTLRRAPEVPHQPPFVLNFLFQQYSEERKLLLPLTFKN